jgi:hypothetical protein
MGIIHSIMVLVDCCRGSADGVVVIFCCTQVEAPTSSGITRLVGSGSARFSHRKPLSRGIASWTRGTQEYRRSDKSTSRSGLVGRVRINAWNKPIHIGSWTTMGPRQPRGFTPACRYIFMVS